MTSFKALKSVSVAANKRIVTNLNTFQGIVANIYAETIIVMVSGYIFWIVMAKVVSPEIIGSLCCHNSSDLALSSGWYRSSKWDTAFPCGVHHKDTNETNVTIFVAVTLTAIGICSVIIAVYVLKNWVFNEFQIRDDLLFIVIILTSFSTFTTLLRSIVISSLKTDYCL